MAFAFVAGCIKYCWSLLMLILFVSPLFVLLFILRRREYWGSLLSFPRRPRGGSNTKQTEHDNRLPQTATQMNFWVPKCFRLISQNIISEIKRTNFANPKSFQKSNGQMCCHARATHLFIGSSTFLGRQGHLLISTKLNLWKFFPLINWNEMYICSSYNSSLETLKTSSAFLSPSPALPYTMMTCAQPVM